ncbi:hypothetical protein U14_01587 [Candidatus Moduliflexus flocculans]|uniref:Uncharacterized protein n=1 Tax=Candidatus Moduliflexus flocculans TaxID=1499966 RepID=A0A0S6VYF2_9BACT|nr:hypothetical protein U14_01587 [Candidatus Moduliflexus flocculans]
MAANSPPGRGWGWVVDTKTPHRTPPTPCPSQEGNCRRRCVTSDNKIFVADIDGCQEKNMKNIARSHLPCTRTDATSMTAAAFHSPAVRKRAFYPLLQLSFRVFSLDFSHCIFIHAAVASRNLENIVFFSRRLLICSISGANKEADTCENVVFCWFCCSF